MTKDFALDQPRACFQRSGVTDAVVNKAKCNGVKHKPAARATPSPLSPSPACRSRAGRSCTPRRTAASTVDTAGPWRPAASCGHSKWGERSRGLGAWLPEAGNPEASEGATCQGECVNRVFYFLYLRCLDVLGLCGPGEGWCESRAHAISHLPYQTLTSPLP